jgi:serine/threonine protein kinase
MNIDPAEPKTPAGSRPAQAAPDPLQMAVSRAAPTVVTGAVQTVASALSDAKARPPRRAGETQGDPGPPAAGRSNMRTAASASGRTELPECGWVIKSRFELVEELGRGGMGAVFRARDMRKVESLDPDPWVAIKFLSAALDGFEFASVSLQREAKHAQTLNHPNIVKVFDFDRDESLVFLTMEVLEGESLQQRLHDALDRPLDEEERDRIAAGILAGVSYAHLHGITHADLKPSNVMVSTGGEPKVLDFGIARRLEHDNVFDADDIGALTVDYASPEMLAGERPTPADDVYALGCIVFGLHTGKHPFDHVRADQARDLRRRPARPRSMSRMQWRALRKSLAFSRKARYENAAAFRRAYLGLDWRRIGIAAALVVAVLGTSAWFVADPVRSYLAQSRLEPQQRTALEHDLHDGAEYLASGYGPDSISAFADVLALDPYNRQARSGVSTAFDQASKAMPARDYNDFLTSQAREPKNPDWIRELATRRLGAIDAH